MQGHTVQRVLANVKLVEMVDIGQQLLDSIVPDVLTVLQGKQVKKVKHVPLVLQIPTAQSGRPAQIVIQIPTAEKGRRTANIVMQGKQVSQVKHVSLVMQGNRVTAKVAHVPIVLKIPTAHAGRPAHHAKTIQMRQNQVPR